MAKILQIDKRHYLRGEIPLYRGDDWHLTGQVLLRENGLEDQPVDLTDMAVSAYFPGATVVASLTDAEQGEIAILVPAADSALATVVESSGMFLVVEGVSGLQTIATLDESLRIQDRGFTQF